MNQPARLAAVVGPTAALTAALGLLSPSASAAAFEAKTMRDTLPAREVERPLILGKGWLEFGIGADVKNATGYWSETGEPVDFSSARWLYTTESLAIRYGITRRGELFWTFRTHYARLVNEALSTDISTFGIGDPSFGYAYEVYRSTAPLTSVIAYASYKAPAANESPGNYTGQANSYTNIILTTGTPDITLGARGKQQLGPLSLTLGAAYVYRVSNVVQYLVETEQYQFNARMKPGNLMRGEGDLALQVGPVNLHGGAEIELRRAIRIGQTSSGLFGDKNLEVVEGSDGWSLDVASGAVFNLTRGVDLDLGVTLPVRGEDFQFFPIEDLHPSRGPTFHGAVELRY